MRAAIVALVAVSLQGTAAPGVVVVDQKAAAKLIAPNAQVEKLAGGLRFVEGPVWRAEDGGYLLFSDIPANELKRWDRAGGVRTFRAPSGNANGNTIDREGRLLTAEHAGRISRTEHDGRVVTVVTSVQGARLSSPNDVVVKSDGTIWFTDPTYGLAGRKQETPGNYVYRFDPATSSATAVVRDAVQPNGLAFSPDERTLYVADSGKPRHIRAFRVSADGTSVDGGRLFATIDQGGPDGIRSDAAGNVWSSTGDGAQVFSPAGALILRIVLPEAGANVAFGGPTGRTFFVTARTSLYAVDTLVRGAPRGSAGR
jgi:gluconolactonase